jgi:ubiquitin carboxyl-terminal hydrolase 7
MAARQNDLRLYLDIIHDPSKVTSYLLLIDTTLTLISLQPDPPPQSIMIFLKHFDTSKQSLLGAGKVYMLRTSKVSELAHVINERMRWTPGTPLKLYEASLDGDSISSSADVLLSRKSNRA